MSPEKEERFQNEVSPAMGERMTKALGAEDDDVEEVVLEKTSPLEEKQDPSPEESEENKDPEKKEENEKETHPEAEIITHRKKTLSFLGYISFFCILPLVLEPKSPFCKIHGKQGMVITITFLILSWVGLFSLFLQFLLWVLHIGLMAYGMFLSFQDQPKKIPVVGDVAEKIDI